MWVENNKILWKREHHIHAYYSVLLYCCILFLLLLLNFTVPLSNNDTYWKKYCKAISSLWAHHRVHVDKPRWCTLLHTEVLWYSLLLLGYKLVQHVIVQNNIKLNETQKKNDAIKRVVNKRCLRLLPAYYCIIFSHIFKSRKMIL